MKMFKCDIAITFYGEKLVSLGSREGRVEVSEFSLGDYRRGMLVSGEEFRRQIKQHYRKQLGRLRLIPPRVVFAGYFGHQSLRDWTKQILYESGARVVYFLERPMAVAIGHSISENIPARRAYLLLDQDVIQVLGVDGLEVTVNYACELELDYLHDLRQNVGSCLGIGGVSPAVRERILGFFNDLQGRGYLDSGVYVWGSSDQARADFIFDGSGFRWTTIKQEYAIEGTFQVMSDLKSLMRAGKGDFGSLSRENWKSGSCVG